MGSCDNVTHAMPPCSIRYEGSLGAHPASTVSDAATALSTRRHGWMPILL